MPPGPQIAWSGDSEGLWTEELTPPASVPEDFRKGPAVARELLLEVSSLFCIGKLHPQGWSMFSLAVRLPGGHALPFQSPNPHLAPRPSLDCLTVSVGLPCYYIKFGFLLLICFMSIQLIGQPTPREGEKRSVPPPPQWGPCGQGPPRPDRLAGFLVEPRGGGRHRDKAIHSMKSGRGHFRRPVREGESRA